MKKLCFLLVIVYIFLITGCSVKIDGKDISSIDISINDGKTVEKTEVKEIPLNGEEILNVSNAVGEIIFVKWDKPAIYITAVKKLKDNKDQNQLNKLFDKIKINTNKSSQGVEVSVQYIEGLSGLHYQQVNLEVKVPENIKIVKADSASGNIKFNDFLKLKELRLTSVSGNVDAKEVEVQNYQLGCTSGNIVASGINGNGSIQTVSGCVTMDKMTGNIDCTTSSGTINSTASSLKLIATTVSGSIDIDEEYLKESSEFKSVSGSLNIKAAKLDTKGAYKLNSTSGGVNFALPDKTGFNLNAKSVSGSVNCDFDLTLQGVNVDNHNKLTGRSGDGGIDLIIETVSGGININKY